MHTPRATPLTLWMNPSNSLPNDNSRALPQTVVLDACVLLNLFASGRVEEILQAVPSRYLVSRYVCREALWYLVPSGETSTRTEKRQIVLDPLVAAGLLEIVDLSAQEQNAFVELAQQLGDGEAASGALALCRSAAVATDDSRARHVFERQEKPLRVIGTATILRSWESRLAVDSTAVLAALQSIRLGARFRPRDDDPDSAWWQDRIREISHH